jgi:hypothetical protein
MRVAAIVLALVSAAGCRRTVPGDGRLVLVRVDAALAALPVQVVLDDGTLATASLEPYVARGVRYWDAVGARLRTVAQRTPTDGPVAADLGIVADSALDRALDGAPAFYSELDGAVHVDRAQLRAQADIYYPEVELAALFAHEAGHALGLEHERAGSGVMAQRCWLPALTATDVAQFERLHGR